jgi:hypothetical protein
MTETIDAEIDGTTLKIFVKVARLDASKNMHRQFARAIETSRHTATAGPRGGVTLCVVYPPRKRDSSAAPNTSILCTGIARAAPGRQVQSRRPGNAQPGAFTRSMKILNRSSLMPTAS